MQHRLQGLVVVGVQQVQKMSLVAKVVSGVVVLFYLLSFIPRVEENLAMIPSYVAPPNVKIWTLVTASFYENRIIFVLLDIVAIIGFTTILEPLWGLKEFLIFSGIVGGVSLASGVLAAVLLYAVSQSYSFLVVPYHGMVALACGYVVAVKQFHPDSVAFPPPAPPTLRVKHLSLLIIIIAFILAIFQVVSYSFCWLAFSGTATAWIYLRFYQKKDQGLRGDMSESFAFATFFPEMFQPPLATLGGFTYHLLVSIKVCPKTVRTYDVGAPSTIKLTLPGTDPVDAQRRKQRALKALDDRLSKNAEPIGWPSLDDAGSSSPDEQSNTPSSSLGPTAVVVEKSPDVPISAVSPQPAQGVASGVGENGGTGSSTSLSSLSGKPAHLKGSSTTVGTKTDSSASFKIESA